MAAGDVLSERSVEAATFHRLCTGMLDLMDEDHWIFLGCLANLYTMRELCDEERDQAVKDALAAEQPETGEDGDWYDDEPELYKDKAT
jgi:hypothetical protein